MSELPEQPPAEMPLTQDVPEASGASTDEGQMYGQSKDDTNPIYQDPGLAAAGTQLGSSKNTGAGQEG